MIPANWSKLTDDQRAHLRYFSPALYNYYVRLAMGE